MFTGVVFLPPPGGPPSGICAPPPPPAGGTGGVGGICGVSGESASAKHDSFACYSPRSGASKPTPYFTRNPLRKKGLLTDSCPTFTRPLSDLCPPCDRAAPARERSAKQPRHREYTSARTPDRAATARERSARPTSATYSQLLADDRQNALQSLFPVREQVDILELPLHAGRHGTRLRPHGNEVDFVERQPARAIESIPQLGLKMSALGNRAAREAGNEKVRDRDRLFDGARPVLPGQQLPAIHPRIEAAC